MKLNPVKITVQPTFGSAAVPPVANAKVNTYRVTSETKDGYDVELVRSGDAPATGDLVIDGAHEKVGIAVDFLREVLGRNSIDGKGGVVDALVGVTHTWAAFGGGQMLLGAPEPGFKSATESLDVIGHELMHGVDEATVSLTYENESGALSESYGDVFGEAIEQWHEDRAGFGTVEGARRADWVGGEDATTTAPFINSLRNPADAAGAAGAQPAHMRDYVTMVEDNGGVHVNVGIPNKAAFEAAQVLGTEQVAKIWYDALEHRLTSTSGFSDAARATIASAAALYPGEQTSAAVRDAWASVGIQP
ncbi:MAG: peptidase [Thermoleophilia bacterium]|nr:peptidase [Thermoleophilia bacterium]